MVIDATTEKKMNPITQAMIERIFELEPNGSMMRAGIVRGCLCGSTFDVVWNIMSLADVTRRWTSM